MQEFTVSSMNDNVFSNILEILHIELLAELHVVRDNLIQQWNLSEIVHVEFDHVAEHRGKQKSATKRRERERKK